MSTFKGFTFKTPTKQEKEVNDENNKRVNDLTFQFSRISAQENEQGETSRLAAFQAHRSPLTGRSGSERQEKRRLEALELQKKQRSITVSKARQLALGIPVEAEEEEEEEEEEEKDVSQEEEQEEEQVNRQQMKRSRDLDEEMEEVSKITKVNPKIKHKGKKKQQQHKKNIYADQIMYSETLESIPNDFYENWVMMICPKGKRCLVTSGSGETIARSRAGNIIGRFQSMIPNGSRTNRTSDFCILDCIYDAVHWTFYVLDIMCWRGYPIFDCDTNFRHFWLQTKLEANELDKPNNDNRFYKFKALKPIPTTETQLVIYDPEKYLQEKQGFEYSIDGLLFYHVQTNYRGGTTPLVNWVPRDNVNSLLS